MIADDIVLEAIINELMANDSYNLTWSYDYPELKLVLNDPSIEWYRSEGA